MISIIKRPSCLLCFQDGADYREVIQVHKNFANDTV